ncbi:hypothetical protein A2165_04370 [Candidatus Curtissbacteria bacterium RBG_13_40_7]|uniref:HEPN domain-containing protein n=1 Tax=Candidatus Curtissbacteria bacterium RBG_13_40_7 TaxID=1797706 RepID=A0A1F5FYT4_9BACT|nr:MAG: hypothetical protein A2165_04370 [Candidatus Curtissbacteria bacterium RBG_13_40_7]
MANFSIVQQWLDRADKDLSIAQSDIKDTKRAEYVAFNCHQATEKFLKAYIIAGDLKFRPTHDLVNLLVEELTPLYLESRYPEFIRAITHKQAKIALVAAEKVAKFIKKKLS